MNIRIIISAIVVIALIAITIMISSYMVNSKKTPNAKPAEEVKLYVKTEPVVYGKNAATVTATGRLSSQNDVDLSSEVQGQILKGDILLKEGNRFREGDLLIRIFDDEARNNLMASKSRFMNAIAGILPDMRIDFPNSFDKWNNFFISLSIHEPLPSLPKLDSDKEKIFLASRNILNDYFNIQSAQIRLAKHRIYAPFDGTFTHVYLEVGSVANPGVKIASMIRTDKLELEVPVEVNEIYWINIGDQVQVTTDIASHTWDGSVVRKSDFVNPNTQSITVYVSVSPSAANPLYQGQYLNATFQSKEIDNSMVIPRNAIFNKSFVWLVVNEKLVSKKVEVLMQAESTVIISGLQEGEQLVVEPLVNAREQMNAEIL
jgi:multidrug efflux pump subunit AcrA (membrane-fusion protein)